jgi:ABC-type antimicrobial peptide transport system permease subunit
MFEPVAQKPPRLSNLLVRTASAHPLQMVTAIQAAVRRIDKHVPIYGVTTLEGHMAAAVAPRRFQAGLLVGFAATALLIAAVGAYGLIQYSIASRTREIGIRIAVGARSAEVFRMVVGEGLKLAGVGLAIGLAGALGLSRAVSGMLFGVTATDPATYFGVACILTLVALAASYFPARRAMKLDPMSALRQD